MREEIKKRIAQREPFLFVDEIVQEDGKSIETCYRVSGDESFFKGHFPGQPIVPGVILQEAAFQTGALLMSSDDGVEGLGVVTRVNNVKFKSMVKPGDTLNIHVSLVEKLANASFFKGKIFVESKLVLSLDFTCAVTESK